MNSSPQESNPTREASNFGYLPYVSSILISNLLFVVLVALLYKVDKAKHLILYEFNTVDPFFSTYLVFLYGFACYAIFIHQLEIDPRNGKDLPKNLFRLVFFTCLLPLYLWVFLMIYNKLEAHTYSVFIGILMIDYFIRLFFSRGNDNKIGLRKTIKEFKEFTTYKNVSLFIFFLCITIFLYFISLYEINLSNPFTTFNPKEYFKQLGSISFEHLYHTINVAIILFITYYYRKFMKEDPFSDFRIAFIFLVFVVLSIYLLHIGTIAPLDILLFYFIVIRVSLFLAGECIRFVAKVILKEFELKSLSWADIFSILGIIVMAIIISTNIISSNKNNYISMYGYKVGFVDTVHMKKSNLTDALEHKIKQRAENNKPLYLIAGQGGGSRAGCTFFTTITKLDSLIGDEILTISTVSGSSNGAGFYLGLKSKLDRIPTDSISLYSKQLYNVDYVTKSMFKLLFTDTYIYKHIIESIFKSEHIDRNESLIDLEASTLQKITKNKFLHNSWEEIYPSVQTELPVFLPITYNVSQGIKAVSSPYVLDTKKIGKTFSVTDSLYASKKSITIGQAISLSEAFPIVSASGVIQGNNYYDGGVYDNCGYEVLSEIYSKVHDLRDSINSNKKIIILSIENSRIESDNELSITQVKSGITAASNSIFTSNTVNHLKNLEQQLPSSDTLIRLKVYLQKTHQDSAEPNFLKKLLKVFEISIDTTGIVMSRYLNQSDIEVIDSLSNEKISTEFTPYFEQITASHQN